MSDKEQMQKFLREEAVKEFGTTNKVLDELRRTRRSRGGTGAPLAVPNHLAGVAAGQAIVITDAELNQGFKEKIIPED